MAETCCVSPQTG